MKNQSIELPVPIFEYPHWRVNFRLDEYIEERIPSLSKCYDVIEKNKVRLRGWDFPHLGSRATEKGSGNTWVEAWCEFDDIKEYWRLYQSGQFIHFFAFVETTSEKWKDKLEADMKMQVRGVYSDEWNNVKGYISIISMLYRITEIFEFAARLCQSGIYDGVVSIDISIRGAKGFCLAAEWPRSWSNLYIASADNFGKSWQFESERIVAESADLALSVMGWFFERFGWLSPSIEALKEDQEKFLKHRV